ncbi:hypothetical protein N7466_000169 [Penicillium verhagenii]|uniref:uncharacterized protein n=1 Tax=Penicillium verhagenii TaxID=1562060 RepID=UPI002544F0EF|nr:uncharacterized protein N7466_000169 [Penicillium verhagenii]KAJ5947154.1 hypothetical protein N7466_000169 [Penicillium verhagenii]
MRPVHAFVPLIGAIGAVATQPSDSWVFGDSLFYLGPPAGNSRITKATYSILPPSVPSGATVSNNDDEVWVSVWVGASSSAGSDDYDLYQPLFNWSLDQESQGCSASVGEWCVAASTYTPEGQIGQNYVTVPKNTIVDFEIAVEDEKVIQIVTIDGEVVSKQSDTLDAALQYLYSSNECYTGSGSCGSLAGYTISNLTITLSEADKGFADVMSLDSVTDKNFKSTDGGITWHADWIKVSAIDFDSSSDTEVDY